jgi:hypothetical protein
MVHPSATPTGFISCLQLIDYCFEPETLNKGLDDEEGFRLKAICF